VGIGLPTLVHDEAVEEGRLPPAVRNVVSTTRVSSDVAPCRARHGLGRAEQAVPATVVVEGAREDRGRVDPGHAARVDRSVSGHQRDAVAIGQERVVADGGLGCDVWGRSRRGQLWPAARPSNVGEAGVPVPSPAVLLILANPDVGNRVVPAELDEALVQGVGDHLAIASAGFRSVLSHDHHLAHGISPVPRAVVNENRRMPGVRANRRVTELVIKRVPSGLGVVAEGVIQMT